MSFKQAKEDTDFWNAYYENQDERFHFKDKSITPEEFYEVWLLKSQYNDVQDKE